MRAEQKNLGGEQSGHVILSDFATTGDGLVAALQVLAVLVRSGKRASEACRVFAPLPQLLRNVRYAGASPLRLPHIQTAIAAASAPAAHHRPRADPRLRHRAADPRDGRRRGFRADPGHRRRALRHHRHAHAPPKPPNECSAF